MKDFVNKYHLIRRILVFAITFIFLKITVNIFSSITLDTFKVTAYGLFCGLETLIIKFYLQSKNDEAEGD